MRGSAYLIGVVAAAVVVTPSATADAQQESEVEIITEPPPAAEPPPSTEPRPTEEEEPAPAPVPPPTAPPPAERPKTDQRKERLGHLRVGGGIGLGFGTDIITVGISPQVSYIIKKIVEPGVALRYQYTKDRFPVPDVVWHTFGSSVFVRLYPIQSLFFLIEGEIINTGFKQGDIKSDRTNYGNLFLGGGYIMGVGKGAFVAVSLKFNIFRNAFYPSHFPIFGIGAGYAF